MEGSRREQKEVGLIVPHAHDTSSISPLRDKYEVDICKKSTVDKLDV
jgi:hypothetical protein